MLPYLFRENHIVLNEDLLLAVDLNRQQVSRSLDPHKQSKLGQYFTPSSVACLMASLFRRSTAKIRLLDAGAGIGSLTAAFIAWRFARVEIRGDGAGLKKLELIYEPPQSIHVTLFEQDIALLPSLQATIELCRQECQRHDVEFTAEIHNEDFIVAAVDDLQPTLFKPSSLRFDCAILNPPYAKIHSKSEHRKLLRRVDIETGNLYSAFVALAVDLLEPDGELVAITPRSFCNGPYFTPFRHHFLSSMRFRHIHVYESRNRAFQEDDVLQENVVFLAEKSLEQERVLITSTFDASASCADTVVLEVDHAQVVDLDDPQQFVHILTDKLQLAIVEQISVFDHSLTDLDLDVSTGRVVDFRAKQFLRAVPEGNTVPLIYPVHLNDGYITWPQLEQKKPNALVHAPETEALLLPNAHYVLVRRFSSKEEARRITAAIFEPDACDAHSIGFENHLNVFHSANKGLTPEMARGLTIYLNSSLVDQYFRQFNGHTQVNATDLRALPYPDRVTLNRLGKAINGQLPSQKTIDNHLREEIKKMSKSPIADPLFAMRKIDEALEVIRLLGLPNAQHNERSALTLLALLDLKPDTPWSEAANPMIGITPIMDYIREYYGRSYAPNTRETIRRQTVHQFVEASLVLPNPDDPERAINSPYWCYQIVPEALNLLRVYGSEAWAQALESYLQQVGTLRDRYAQMRRQRMIPVTIEPAMSITTLRPF